MYNEAGELIPVDLAVTGKYKKYADDEVCLYGYRQAYVRNDGVKVRGHFFLNVNNPFFVDSNGGGESEEHYNAKMKIVHERGYFDTVLNKRLEFARVVPEKRYSTKQPDLSCYDSEGNLVLCIEIKKTNAKTAEDIKELKKLNVPITEIDINHEPNRIAHIVLPTLLDVQREQLRKYETKINRVRSEIDDIEEWERKRRTNACEQYRSTITRISELKEKIELTKREIIRAEQYSIADDIERVKREIAELERKHTQSIDTDKLTRRIQTYRERVQFYYTQLSNRGFILPQSLRP